MRRFLFISVYVFACVLFAIVLAEFALRTVHPDWETMPLYRPDPLTILVPRPDMTDPLTDSLGAWGEPLPASAPTVLVFGDSNVQAEFAKPAESYPARLEEALGLRVANFGVVGYGPDQSVLRLGGLLERKAPLGSVRAVVLHTFADNDLGDLLRNNLPAFNPGIDNGGVHVEPELVGFGALASRYLVARVIRDRVLSSPLRAWVLPERYYETTDDLLSQDFDEFRHYRAGAYASVFADHYETAIALDAEPALTVAVTAAMERVFRLFAELSQQHHFCPLVVVEPSEMDVAETAEFTREDMAQYASAQGKSYDRRRLTSLVEGTAARAGLPIVPLFDAFEGKPFYFTEEELPGDDHWNEAGMLEAARLTAEALRRTCPEIAGG